MWIVWTDEARRVWYARVVGNTVEGDDVRVVELAPMLALPEKPLTECSRTG
jgi:hypothetical protein